MVEAELLINRATKHARRGSWTLADFYFRAAAQLCVQARLTYARELKRLGRTESAARELYRAWEQAKRQGSAPLRSECCRQLSNHYRAQNDLLRAQQFQQFALSAHFEAQSSGELAADTPPPLPDSSVTPGGMDRQIVTLCRARRWKEAIQLCFLAAEQAIRESDDERAHQLAAAAIRLQRALDLRKSRSELN